MNQYNDHDQDHHDDQDNDHAPVKGAETGSARPERYAGIVDVVEQTAPDGDVAGAVPQFDGVGKTNLSLAVPEYLPALRGEAKLSRMPD